jgi:hypothetical protein
MLLFIKNYHFFTILSILGIIFSLIFIVGTFDVELFCLLFLLIILFLSPDAWTPHRWTTFLLESVYVTPIFYSGVKLLSNPNWVSGYWWDHNLLENIGQHGIFFFLFSLPAVKWNLLVLIPFTLLSSCLLFRKFWFRNYHIIFLISFHSMCFFMDSLFNPDPYHRFLPLLQIGILFFLLPLNPSKLFQMASPPEPSIQLTSGIPKLLIPVLLFFMLVQAVLPLRPYFFSEDIHWTWRGVFFAWRMKLNDVKSFVKINIVDRNTNETFTYQLDDLHYRSTAIKSTVYSQVHIAHIIRELYAKHGVNVSVYSDSYISLNSSSYYRLIDPTVDLSRVKFNIWGPNLFVLPSPEEQQKRIPPV